MQYEGSYVDLKFEKQAKIHVWKGQVLQMQSQIFMLERLCWYSTGYYLLALSQ